MGLWHYFIHLQFNGLKMVQRPRRHLHFLTTYIHMRRNNTWSLTLRFCSCIVQLLLTPCFKPKHQSKQNQHVKSYAIGESQFVAWLVTKGNPHPLDMYLQETGSHDLHASNLQQLGHHSPVSQQKKKATISWLQLLGTYYLLFMSFFISSRY
jgi:hypothetical protein